MSKDVLLSGTWKNGPAEVTVSIPLIIFNEDGDTIVFCPALDLSGKRILEIYRDVDDDVYLVDGVNPVQFLFNSPGDFIINSVFVTGGFGTAGYLYYLHDGDQEFLLDIQRFCLFCDLRLQCLPLILDEEIP